MKTRTSKIDMILLIQTSLSICLTLGYSVMSFGFKSTENESNCSFTEIEKSKVRSRYDLRIGKRSISILGWQHPDPSLQEKLSVRSYLEKAALAAQQFECQTAFSQLENIRSLVGRYHASNLNMLMRLREIKESVPLQSVAVEASPEEWGFFKAEADNQAQILSFINLRCTPSDETLIPELFISLVGPVHMFRTEFPGALNLLPVENDAAKARARPAAQVLTTLTREHPLRISDIPSKAKNSFTYVMNKMVNGEKIQQTEVDQVISDVAGSSYADVIVAYAQQYKLVMDAQEDRNEAIVKSLVAAEGNTVLAIGNAHASDLANRILHLCQNPGRHQ